MAATYSPRKTQVPSAIRGLTSLFGMGRGEHPWQNHHKIFSKIDFINLFVNRLSLLTIQFKTINYNKIILEKLKSKPHSTFLAFITNWMKKNKAYGQLVLLGFNVTIFTPIAYQRHSLWQPLKVNSSFGRFHA